MVVLYATSLYPVYVIQAFTICRTLVIRECPGYEYYQHYCRYLRRKKVYTSLLLALLLLFSCYQLTRYRYAHARKGTYTRDRHQDVNRSIIRRCLTPLTLLHSIIKYSTLTHGTMSYRRYSIRVTTIFMMDTIVMVVCTALPFTRRHFLDDVKTKFSENKKMRTVTYAQNSVSVKRYGILYVYLQSMYLTQGGITQGLNSIISCTCFNANHSYSLLWDQFFALQYCLAYLNYIQKGKVTLVPQARHIRAIILHMDTDMHAGTFPEDYRKSADTHSDKLGHIV